VFSLYSQLKPKLAGMQMYGGTAWTTLHHDFVNYTWSCLVGKHNGDEYCHSLQALLKYLETNFCPEELFVQTALFNGPYCTARNGPQMGASTNRPCSNSPCSPRPTQCSLTAENVRCLRSGNLRWESWDIKNSSGFAVAQADKHTLRPGPFTLQCVPTPCTVASVVVVTCVPPS
jgi:hypothetical protein